MSRRWLNIELPRETAKRFRGFLRDIHVNFETSEAGNLIHFEVLVTRTEEREINKFLDTLVNQS